MEEHVFGGKPAKQPDRQVFQAMQRGFLGRCPHCGRGRLFRAFLKTVDRCSTCGEEMNHHRADDLPAYLVIVIVGHVVVGAFMGVEAATQWPGWVHLSMWLPLTVLMSLALIGPVKGSVVGLQWALRMHGFDGEQESLKARPEL